jgi:hypothetical protein
MPNLGDLSAKDISAFLKTYYAAELGIAAVSEISLATSGWGAFLAPVVKFQRLNAAVQTVGWAALIAYLDTLESPAPAQETTV